MRRGRLKWKNLLAAIVAVIVLISVIAAIASIANRKSIAIKNFSFSIGALDEAGAFREYNQAIVSDYFECRGLTVEPMDTATGRYRVFYYTEDKKFLGKTDEMNPMDGVYEKGDDFMLAKYARVLITPDAPADEEGSDFRIRFWEVGGYASGFTVTVDKVQRFLCAKELNFFKNVELCGSENAVQVLIPDGASKVVVAVKHTTDAVIAKSVYLVDEIGEIESWAEISDISGATVSERVFLVKEAKYLIVEGLTVGMPFEAQIEAYVIK